MTRATPARVSEGVLSNRIRLALDEALPELVLWRNSCGFDAGARVRYGIGNPGGADLIGCYRGRFIAIEIKTPTGRQTDEQKQFEQLVTARGGVYAVIRSVDEAKAWAEGMRELDHAHTRSVGGCTCRSNTVACPLHAEERR